jgi:hypothetical protein
LLRTRRRRRKKKKEEEEGRRRRKKKKEEEEEENKTIRSIQFSDFKNLQYRCGYHAMIRITRVLVKSSYPHRSSPQYDRYSDKVVLAQLLVQNPHSRCRYQYIIVYQYIYHKPNCEIGLMFTNFGIWLTGTFNSDKNPMISPMISRFLWVKSPNNPSFLSEFYHFQQL